MTGGDPPLWHPLVIGGACLGFTGTERPLDRAFGYHDARLFRSDYKRTLAIAT